MQTAIYAIIIFSLLIFIHEFGHFFVAKLVGVRVEEFSIGMGPKALAFKKGDTQYSLRILPIGGYVKMTGMSDESLEDEESDLSADDPRRFNNKTVLQRAAVIVAGPLMNLLLAILIFTFMFSSIGLPFYSSQVGEVVENSPAAAAGLQKDDKIVAVDGKEVGELNEVIQIIRGRSGEDINFTIDRDGKMQNVVIAPEFDEEQKADLIGIMATEPQWQKFSLSESFIKSHKQTYEVITLTLTEITKMITGKVGTEGLAGPVGIVKIIDDSAKVGIIPILNLTALISISLGLMNLLPIPALDGSRLIFLLIEGIRGKPIDAQKENLVHFVGLALLMVLMIVITYKDIMGLGSLG